MSGVLRILIVDDEAAIRELLVRVISKTHQASGAASGQEAVELAQAQPFDVAFVDMRMPGMDGLDTMRALKKICPEITIVIITGYADNDRIETALLEGAVTCLRKPFHLDDVRQVLAREMTYAQDRPLNILVVDDDQTFRTLFLSLNDSGQYVVESVSSATEAVEALKAKKYDVCFIDIVLPDFSGFRLYEECRNIAPETNVVLFTGSDEKFAAIKAKALEGAKYSLKKPFDIQEVRNIISKIEQSRR